MKYPSSVKLWRVIKERDVYYYEIKLAGEVVDRLKIESPSLEYLQKEGVI